MKETKKSAATTAPAAKKKEKKNAKPTTRKKETKAKSPVKWKSPKLADVMASDEPPVLPPCRPELVEAVISSTPDIFKGHVAVRCFAPLAIYPKDLSFTYIDNLPRSLRINCLALAESGGGKDTSFQEPRNHILKDMDLRDTENRKRIDEYKAECARSEGAEKTPKRPDDVPVQIILDNITPAELVQKMLDSKGATLYVGLNELERWDNIEGKKCHDFNVMKTIDDENNTWGADRAGVKSVSGKGCLRLNWDSSTTLAFGQKYFGRGANEGAVSRVTMVMLPEQPIGAPAPIYGNFDAKYDARLKPFIENLKAAKGLVNCKEAKTLANKLKEEFDEFNSTVRDRVLESLAHRSYVAAFRKACLIYAANGMKWEKGGVIENFCRWSFQMDLWCKYRLFIDLIREADEKVRTAKTGPRNKLSLLAEEFTFEDAIQMRKREGMKEKGTYDMLAQWLFRGYIRRVEQSRFKKTDKGLAL